MFEVIVKPILLRMFAKRHDVLPLSVTLDRTIEVEPAYEHRIPVRLSRESDGIHAQPLLGTSAQMHILAFADALVSIPLGTSRVAAGARLDAVPFTRTRGLG